MYVCVQLFVIFGVLVKGVIKINSKTKEKKLSQREKLFCFFYALSSDGKESAIKSGFKKETAEETFAKLLMRKEVKAEIKKARKELFEGDEKSLAKLGLCKIAFGNPSDLADAALKLRNGEGGESLKGDDLFCVSEIKIGKNDCFEFKLFDKIKALEALSNLKKGESEEEEKDLSFFEALYKGEEKLNQNEN